MCYVRQIIHIFGKDVPMERLYYACGMKSYHFIFFGMCYVRQIIHIFGKDVPMERLYYACGMKSYHLPDWGVIPDGLITGGTPTFELIGCC